MGTLMTRRLKLGKGTMAVKKIFICFKLYLMKFKVFNRPFCPESSAVLRRFSLQERSSYYGNPLFFLKDTRGVAVAEMLPLLVVFVMLFGLTFGFWSTIHSGTLSSIGARHYAFEVLNNRTHFIYHRDEGAYAGPRGNGEKSYYKDHNFRFFAVVKKQGYPLKQKALERKLSLFTKPDSSGGSNKMWINAVSRPNQYKANPIWIKAGYGICINFECGIKCGLWNLYKC